MVEKNKYLGITFDKYLSKKLAEDKEFAILFFEDDIKNNKILNFGGLLERLKYFPNVSVIEMKTKYKIKITNIKTGSCITWHIQKKYKENCNFALIYQNATTGFKGFR